MSPQSLGCTSCSAGQKRRRMDLKGYSAVRTYVWVLPVYCRTRISSLFPAHDSKSASRTVP